MIKRYVPSAALSVVVAVLLFGTSGTAQRSLAKPGSGLNPKARQTRPIQLGTSGGNVFDLANGFCCSGTLGALVRDNSNFYILSNTHVFAGDSVPGGNNRTARIGDPVSQPGLIDVGCANRPADYVGEVSRWAVLGADNVDAAIAQISSADAVSTSGAILGIGTISALPASAFVGQPVKKTGRTTGLSRSSVSALNATVNVGYSNECAGGSFTVEYTGQIMIRNRGSKFLAGGDSGSLMVEDIDTNPRPVGLLYAGSSTVAIANPIQDVLEALNVTMVGTGVTPSGGRGAEGKSAGANAQGLSRAMAVQQRHGNELFSVPGAVGHGVGVTNRPVIKIFVDRLTPEARAAAPTAVEGIPVVLEEVGTIVALPSCRKQ
jgi:hypothetical protein